MIPWWPRWFALLVLLPFVPVVTGDADDQEIGRLVKQLGSDKFKEREAASARLKQIVEPTLDALHKAAASNDPEVRRRAEKIIAVIENKLFGPELCLLGYSVSISADGKL